jgi:hypothetical protein
VAQQKAAGNREAAAAAPRAFAISGMIVFGLLSEAWPASFLLLSRMAYGQKKTRLRSQGLEAASRKLAEQQDQRSFQCRQSAVRSKKLKMTSCLNLPQLLAD